MAERGKDDTEDGSGLAHPLCRPEDRLTHRSTRGTNMKLQAVILLGLALATATFAEVRLQKDGASVPILIFHSVRPYRPTDLKRARRYIVTPYTLDKELGYLKEKGYVSVSFDDLAHRLALEENQHAREHKKSSVRG
jgi:hypothetical protein